MEKDPFGDSLLNMLLKFVCAINKEGVLELTADLIRNQSSFAFLVFNILDSIPLNKVVSSISTLIMPVSSTTSSTIALASNPSARPRADVLFLSANSSGGFCSRCWAFIFFFTASNCVIV